MRAKLRGYKITALILILATLFSAASAMQIASASTNTSQTMLTQKTVKWADGSTETLKVDGSGQIFLNGIKTVAFGLHIVTMNMSGYADAGKILKTLQSNGIRFMVLDASSWLNVPQALSWINWWMPWLYSYKMWVVLNIQDNYVQNLPPPGGSCTIFNVTAANMRVAGIVDGIVNPTYASMIFAVGYNWELDNIGYSNSQVAQYLSSLYPVVKQTIDSSLIGAVPILGKNMASASPCGTTAIVKYSDIPTYDCYITTTGSWTQYFASSSSWVTETGNWQANINSLATNFHAQTLPAAGKNGFQVWFGEAGPYATSNNPNSYTYTPAMLQAYLNDGRYKDTSAIFIWTLEWNSVYPYAAFDFNGNPYPWFANILSYFAANQALFQK